ncbi:MAG: CinA family protein [Oscillospiraceae bacterium]|nr:CinA family protein [Oscillospiraceae bacterium]
MITKEMKNAAEKAVESLKALGLTVGCAESCTGGLLAGTITSVSGASSVFECGIVSYSERIKSELLGMTREFINEYGVVSQEVSLKMAQGVIKLSGCDVGIGITGIAGPAGGTDEQPVGTVYVSVVYKNKEITKNLKLYEKGNFDRDTNRLLTVSYALKSIVDILKG